MTSSSAATLDGIRLLGSLTPEERRALAGRCSWKRYHPGERILSRDSDCREEIGRAHV